MSVVTTEVIVGKLLRRKIINDLYEMRFMGYDIEWFERKYLLESRILIKGSESDINYVKRYFKKLEEDL